MTDEDDTRRGLATRLAHFAEPSRATANPPVLSASTVFSETAEDLYRPRRNHYGRMGLELHWELEAALAMLEGGVGTVLTPNGLSACTLAIQSCVKAGDHVLFVDSIYGPTRRFLERTLARYGIRVSPFDARIGADIASLITDTTSLIVLESPGSLTFEVVDLPAITATAREAGVRTIVDNTWGAGVLHRPLAHGADLSVQALTKYTIGHADRFGGAIIAADETVLHDVRDMAKETGMSLGPDEAAAALRGLRTLVPRLRQHEAAGLALAELALAHDAVNDVLHPALTSHPDHAIWQRDFSGSNGLFGLVLKSASRADVNAALDGQALFRFGFSWGGFESLIIPCDPQLCRTVTPPPSGPLLRVHAGLEDLGDLTAALAGILDRLVP